MTAEPRLYDALALAAQAADEILVQTARDAHLASVRRVHGWLRKPVGEGSHLIGLAHHGIAGAVYASVGAGLRATSVGLGAAAAVGVGPLFETGPRSSFVRSAVNGLIGERLERERPRLAIPLALRVAGRDVELTPAGLASSYPQASGTVVVFVHGLSENESYWNRGRAEVGRTYADTVRDAGATPVFVRLNSGLAVRANGAALVSTLQQLVDAWPVPVTRLVLVGHSMGGLILRSALGVRADVTWPDLVTDVVTLGTPHLGAPLAHGVGRAAEALSRLPETSGFGRILDQRSVGVHDLVEGIADLPDRPDIRYRLVAATLASSPRHPVSRFFGDLLVRVPSAYGESGALRLFPDADVLHLPRADHFDLLNDPRVHTALARWLAD